MIGCILLAGALGMGALSLEPVTPEIRAGHCCEFRVVGQVPRADNPFDPDVIRLDAVFTGPSGKTGPVPVFWKQEFCRSLENDHEKLEAEGEPGWRVRFTPWEAGAYQCEITLGENGSVPAAAGSGSFEALSPQGGARGYIRIEQQRKRFFQYADGMPMPLVGSNLCWPGGRGTYDYDDWLPERAAAGMNFARIWMWPLAFGIEVLPGERLNYNQSQAWRLDHVMALAAEKGTVVMLCIDYHGIFQDQKDMWGGNDYWPTHPYNRTEGGPCATQNDFFTSPEAQKLYEKRLRYLIGRFGAYPSLMSWEFFNEINNVYDRLKRDDVIRWHGAMADVLHTTDPFHHPVSTSFGGVFEDRRMWEVPSLDFTQYHLYCDSVKNGLGVFIGDTARRMHDRYQKPMVIAEFGATYKNDGRVIDPADRSLHQGLWTGLLSGSAGTVMPWWWENIKQRGQYSLWASISQFIAGTGFGGKDWHPARVETPPEPKPVEGPLVPEPGASAFDAELGIESEWNERPSGDLVLRAQEDADAAPLPSYLHGTVHEERRIPFRIRALFGENASVRAKVDAVSEGARLALRVDGKTCIEREIPNKDGKSEVNGEYTDLYLESAVPSGDHTFELVNTGSDWAHVCAVRLTGVLPAAGPQTNPGADAFAMTDGKTALAYLVDRRYEYPRGRGTMEPRSCQTLLTLRGLADGTYTAVWWDPAAGAQTASAAAECRDGALVLATPAFRVDAAVRVVPVVNP